MKSVGVLGLVASGLLCAFNPAQAARCPDKPGLPIPGCPERPFPPAVATADKGWFHCLVSSMPVQMKRVADLNEAAEAAFAACQTEEQGLRAALMGRVSFHPRRSGNFNRLLEANFAKSDVGFGVSDVGDPPGEGAFRS
jgi:hypothetical protein